jgi:hypothetical protein
MNEKRRGGWVGGLILIMLGVVFLVQQLFPDAFGGWMFLAGLGAIFLIAYVLTQQYGFLIPGCILSGLSVGVALIETNTVTGPGSDGVVVLSLGLSFVAIWLIDMLVARGRFGGWWPLIPGTILTVVGAAVFSNNEAWLQDYGKWWPVVFIVVGLWILIERWRRPQ